MRMKQYTTIIKALDPSDGKMKVWQGPFIPAESFEKAREYCDNNGLGYCEVHGELVECREINAPCNLN